MSISTFSELGLIEPLQRAVRDENYTTPTPIQERSIPSLLEGRDLMGCAQTGTGKTAAFALPILQRLANDSRPLRPRSTRALILTPTRELAAQIADSFRVYGRHLRLTRAVVFGGVPIPPQIRALSRGVDILVATPGRMLDLLGQRCLDLSSVEIFVLDEADRMLDMGFLPDIRRVLAALPKERQTLFFSATLPPPIVQLASRMVTDPVRVDVSPTQPTADRIEQKVLFVEKAHKPALLGELLKGDAVGRVLIFTRTKHGANKLVKHLDRISVSAEAIHGNKTQSARTQALEKFRAGRVSVLVATDIAARGIDVDGITHVINYDMPMDPESYIHRIGRTARAGASGVAFSFCDSEERGYLRGIERLIRRSIPVMQDHPYHNRPVGRHGADGQEQLSGRRYAGGTDERRGRDERDNRDSRGYDETPARRSDERGYAARDRSERFNRTERRFDTQTPDPRANTGSKTWPAKRRMRVAYR